MTCARCEYCRWVFDPHDNRPWLGRPRLRLWCAGRAMRSRPRISRAARRLRPGHRQEAVAADSRFSACALILSHLRRVPSRHDANAMSSENDNSYDGLAEAIALRWLLRDIRANRWTFVPLDPARLQRAIEMGLAEMVDDAPTLTELGSQVIEGT